MNATYSDLLPATKTEPTGAGIDWTPTADETGPRAGVLTIKGKRAYCTYTVCEFPTGWDGRGFHLAKLDAGTDASETGYSCFVARNGQDKQCECKGFQFSGHCRHLAALAQLLSNGWL